MSGARAFAARGRTLRSSAGLSGLSVLVLEDEVFVALELQALLEERGAEVAQAFTVAEALDALEAARIDAAVLDVRLGAETCEPVAACLRERGTPFLLHTGDLRGNGELVERIGAPVVPKPAGEGEVPDRLEALLEERRGRP